MWVFWDCLNLVFYLFILWCKFCVFVIYLVRVFFFFILDWFEMYVIIYLWRIVLNICFLGYIGCFLFIWIIILWWFRKMIEICLLYICVGFRVLCGFCILSKCRLCLLLMEVVCIFVIFLFEMVVYVYWSS